MLKVYDSTNFYLLFSFQAHTGAINQIKQLPNGYVATTSNDALVKIWNPSTSLSSTSWSLMLNYTGHRINVNYVEYINEYTIASTSIDDMTIQIWAMNTGILNRTINTRTNSWSLQLLSNCFHLAVGLNSRAIDVYDINTGNLVYSLIERSYDGPMNPNLAFISNETLASASTDTFVRIWNLTAQKIKFNLSGHTNHVMKLKLVSSDILASGSSDYTINLWNTTSGSLLRTLSCHTGGIRYAIETLNDGKTLVSGSGDKTIKFWNFNTGECLYSINTGLNINSLAILYSLGPKSNL